MERTRKLTVISGVWCVERETVGVGGMVNKSARQFVCTFLHIHPCYKSEAGPKEFNTSVVCLLFPTGLIHYWPSSSPSYQFHEPCYTLSQIKFTVSHSLGSTPWLSVYVGWFPFNGMLPVPLARVTFSFPLLYTIYISLIQSRKEDAT
jgi:hypothetical protein